MIITKKKFERLVEEEVCKRMNAIEERRWMQERFGRMEERMEHIEANVCKLFCEAEEFKAKRLRHGETDRK